MKVKLHYLFFLLLSVPLFAQPTCGTTYAFPTSPGNYQNNENTSTVICADFPGDQVVVTFSAFDVEAFNDGLYVFDGNSALAPQISSGNPAGNVPGGLPGAYWGTDTPGPFISSSPNGCLTFVFKSNATVGGSGWNAEITCGLDSECMKPTNLVATAATATTMLLDWNDPMGTTWQIFAVPCGTVPYWNSPPIIATTHPFYITGLNPDTCYSFYIRTACDPSGYSMPAGPVNGITQIAPPVCGGSFADNGGPSNNYSDNMNQTITICPTVPGDLVTATFTSFATEANFDGLYVFSGPSEFGPQFSSGNGAGSVPGGASGSFWGNGIPGPFTSTTLDGCLTFKFRSNAVNTAAGWIANISCGPPNADGFYLKPFDDLNANGVQDSNESNTVGGLFQIQSGGTTVLTGSNFSNTFYPVTDPSQQYNLTYLIDPLYAAYYTNNSAYSNVSVAAGSGLNVYSFPLVLTAPYNDLAVSMTGYGQPTAGNLYTVRVDCRNSGTSPVSGNLSFVKHPSLSILSTTFTIDPNPNGFSIALPTLNQNENFAMLVVLQIPPIPSVNLGDLITNSVSATFQGSEVTLVNNTASLSGTVVGSYDPNDITESHGPQLVHSQFTSSDYLYYTIRFQNTGTANASKVVVQNTLDNQLNAGTVQMIYSSHNYTMIRNGSQLSWEFNDIQLPPESVNAQQSNGFVTYTIKPNPGYAVGDIIPNTAEIYFDTNPAIVTNTFNTEFVNALSTASFEVFGARLYPNPATNSVQVSLKDASDRIIEIAVYDVSGKVVQKSKPGSATCILNISGFSKGVYMIGITTENNERQMRKLIVQ